jgi:hypothetical protein
VSTLHHPPPDFARTRQILLALGPARFGRAPSRPRAVALLVAWLGLAACGGSHNYNHARSYEPLRAERGHHERGQVVPYEDVKRDPNGFKDTEIAWFGVVRGLEELPDGKARLALELRAHQARHQCAERSESSCRLTIAERDLGPFSVDVALAADEKSGRDRVWVGSLLKIYGRPTGDYDDRGGPILAVDYYRHWPRGTYVTTGQRGGMRR